MAKEITHEKLGVSLRRDEESGYTEFGVVVDGAFVPFTARRNGDVDPELAAAAEAKASAAAASTSTDEPAG